MPLLPSGPRAARRVAAFTLTLAACAHSDLALAPRPADPVHHRARTAPHVLVISIDGLRGDAVDSVHTPTLARLRRDGSGTMEASTIYPSKTLPSHTSMLTGVLPAVHGITWNDDRTAERGTVTVPTVFGVAREAGLTTAAIFSKTKFHHLQVPGTLDYTVSPTARGDDKWKADRVVKEAEQYLATGRPDLLFVHFGEPDYAGHSRGWMSESYREAVARADAGVAAVIAAAERAVGEGNLMVIVTADHGGHGRSHGTADPRDMTIPWIAWGAGVKPGTTVPPGVRTTDTAATVLWALGVAVPAGWEGRPVAAAFEPSPVFAGAH